MIEIRPSGLADLSYILSNLRSVDKIECLCLLPDVPMSDVAYGLLSSYQPVSAWYNDNPVAAYYFAPLTVSTASVSLFGTNDIRRAIPALTREILDKEIPNLRLQGFRRFEARSHIDHTQAHKWLEGCGAINEGILRQYGRNGEDFFMFGLTYKENNNVS